MNRKVYPHTNCLSALRCQLVWGFTLVELMVVLIIFMVILLSIYAALFAGEKSWQSSNIKSELQSSLRNAMETIIDELRQTASSQITIGIDNKLITFSVPVQVGGLPDTETIFLQSKSGISQETIKYTYPVSTQWGAYTRMQQQYNTVIYFLSENEKAITRRVLDSSGAVIEDFIIAYNVATLSFTRPVNSDRITISALGEKTTQKEYPIKYSIIASVHYENDSF